MLSTSLETQVRGDEGQRCNQLAQYRSIRLPRSTEDVELIKTPEMANVKRRLHKKFGKYQQDEPQAEENYDEPPADIEEQPDEGENELVDIGEQNTGLVDVASNAVSQCPVENGVLHSPWGSFSGGTVITGLAAGLQPQTITVRDLVMGDESFGQLRKFARQQAPGTMNVDNRFAATLSGDIAEAVLRQSPATIQVGASGAWNNSAVPNWYFLSQRERLEMTDAEIRGGLDGLILATNIANWRQRANTLRLSQVLDMYYTQRGIFGMVNPETSIRACNRNAHFTTVAPIAQLQAQSNAFTTVLDGEMQTQVTLTPNSTQRISAQASMALFNYVSK